MVILKRKQKWIIENKNKIKRKYLKVKSGKDYKNKKEKKKEK